jgi:hypothetical protein
MSEDPSEFSAILVRLAKLERENRNLKRTGFAVLALVLATVLMGQATPPSKTVEAQRFTLKDATGRIRASLDTVDDNALLTLYGPQGEANKLGFTAEIGAGPGGPFVFLMNGKNGDPGAQLVELSDLSGKPSLQLFDGEGFQAVIGKTDLVLPGTGETRNGSAASIILAGKNRTVLWSAP